MHHRPIARSNLFKIKNPVIASVTGLKTNAVGMRLSRFVPKLKSAFPTIASAVESPPSHTLKKDDAVWGELDGFTAAILILGHEHIKNGDIASLTGLKTNAVGMRWSRFLPKLRDKFPDVVGKIEGRSVGKIGEGELPRTPKRKRVVKEEGEGGTVKKRKIPMKKVVKEEEYVRVDGLSETEILDYSE